MEKVFGPLPPFGQAFDFLPEKDHQAVLAWALEIQDQFKPATVTKGRVGSDGRIDPDVRIALTTGKLSPIEPMLRRHLSNALDWAIAKTGVSGPRPTSLELHMAAHGDGAHFAPHLDIPIGPNRNPLASDEGSDRIISAVYYFHAEPRAFSGGHLRLYAFGIQPGDCRANPDDHVDIEPMGNSLVVFPAWVTHQVGRTACPTADFRDYRFAINCWYCRPLAHLHDN